MVALEAGEAAGLVGAHGLINVRRRRAAAGEAEVAEEAPEPSAEANWLAAARMPPLSALEAPTAGVAASGEASASASATSIASPLRFSASN